MAEIFRYGQQARGYKVKNTTYTQAEGRRELFDRGRRKH
jgi:hypothetical protein